MYFMARNVRIILLRLLIFDFLLFHSSLSYTLNTNKSVKSASNRKNDKFYRFFTKKSDVLSAHNSELRHSNIKFNQKLNISLIVSERNNSRTGITGFEPQFHNEFTLMETKENIRHGLGNAVDKQCQCNCDPHRKAEELINEFVLTEEEDPDIDIDDNDELIQLQKPYKYIPMETIELAHQRPQRVTSTAAPPTQPNPLKALIQSMTSYLNLTKYSTTNYVDLAISMAVTGILGFIGVTNNPLNAINSLVRRMSGYNDRNYGYYNRFYLRQLNDTNNDWLSVVYDWILSLN